MKVSYKHIIKCINEKPSIDELSEKLFQLGHEHEIDGDIINLELTPNRGDCFSIRGILRDLNLFYDTNPSKKVYDDEIDSFKFRFKNYAENACPKISFLKIEIDSIPSTYDKELESYFSELKLHKNNFFTDISNYISYETGQPTHCYDASKVQDGIKLDFSKEKLKFHTLLDQKIEISPGELIFLNDQNEVINLAGIMGGASSSCNVNTKSVIVECAYFNPEVILGKALKYSVNSEASHKFERNVDPDCHEYVMRRFIQLVQEHTEILNVQIFSNIKFESPKKIIDLDVNKVNQILGTSISEEDCIHFLSRLGFIIDGISIHVPSFRHDIIGINDIAEEIARAIGYDNIQPVVFNISKNESDDILNNNEAKIKNLLIHNGFCEVINDPFTKEHDNSSIKVDNPLDISKGFLRTSLKSSLLKNLIYNERRQQDSIKLFEIADIYTSETNSPKKFLGIIVSGRVDKNFKDFNKKLDQQFIENFINKHFNQEQKLKTEIISRDNLKSKTKNIIAFTEIELDDSLQLNYPDENNKKISLDIKYIPISDYPSSTRDLSFSVTNFPMCEILQEYILNLKDDLLKEIFIFDYFLNEKNHEIKIGFRLVFQSKKSTIKEKEVNYVIDKIINHTKSINGVTIPGLK